MPLVEPVSCNRVLNAIESDERTISFSVAERVVMRNVKCVRAMKTIIGRVVVGYMHNRVISIPFRIDTDTC